MVSHTEKNNKIRLPGKIETAATYRQTIRLIGFLAVLSIFWTSFAGCVAPEQTQPVLDQAKDYRPFVSRSKADARERIDKNTDTDRLLALLAEGDARQMVEAALALGDKKEEKASFPLIGLLNHTDPSVRFASGRALTQIGKPAVPELSWALTGDDTVVAGSAAEILGGIGGSEAFKALSEQSRNTSEEIRIQVLAAMVKLAPEKTLPLLIAEIADRDSTVRYTAAKLAVEAGDPAVKPLAALLDSDDPDVLSLASDALGKIGNPEPVNRLIDLLDRKQPEAVRMSATRALGGIGDPAAVHALAEALSDEVSVVRQLAAEALAAIGAAAVPPIIKALSEDDPEIRDLASQALVKIGSPAVDPLTAIVADQDPETAWLAIDTLGGIGDAKAVPAIADQLDNPNKDIALVAVEALGAIGHDSAVVPLAAALQSSPSGLGTAISEALVKIGSPAADVLCGLLGDENPEVRQLSADILVRLDTRGMDTVVSWLKKTSGPHQEALAKVLSAIGAPAVPQVAQVLPECDPSVQEGMVGALTKIGGKESVEALVSALQNWNTRRIAADGLDSLNWKPETSEELVFYQVATGKNSQLETSWDVTRYVLLKKLNSGKESSANYAADAFIALGDDRILPDMVLFLEKKGTESLATIYWHSENPELETSAQQWFETNGIEDPELIMDKTLPKITWDSMTRDLPGPRDAKAAE